MPLQLAPLLSELKIRTKDAMVGGPVKFPIYSEFAWAQREYLQAIETAYNAGKPVRLIVLKARQLGISTATEGVLFNWAHIHPGSNGMVVANLADTVEELFETTKLMYDSWPFKKYYPLKYSTKRHMRFEGTLSSIKVATAKNVAAGRGSTLHALHATEVAFYPDPKTLMTGLYQTIPNKHGTLIVLESTANGSGDWWHEQWQAAEEGESEYIPLFFPWFKHPEYQMRTTLSSKLELDADELQLLRIGATYQNIQWRRWAIRNLAQGDLDIFMQEYPSTSEEAFLVSGQPVFSHRALDKCFVEEKGVRGALIDKPEGGVRFYSDPHGNVTIFRKPVKENRDDRYFISGDPSMTVMGDPACAQVFNRATGEQVAVWHGRIDPISFADEMMRLGKYYNMAMLCPEIEGGGQAAVATMIAKNYPSIYQQRYADKAQDKVAQNYGWSTNYTRKQWIIAETKKRLLDESILLHDRVTYNQMRNYVLRQDGTLGNANYHVHDDSVMALAINITASAQQGPFDEYAYERAGRHQDFDLYGETA